MKAILREVKLVECKNSTGAKFRLVEFKADVKINDKGDVKTLKGSYGEEFAQKYFTYCRVKTKDLIGKEVEVVVAKRSYEKDGESRVVSYIKYLNVLDKEGKPIYLPKDNEDSELDF